ncbi:MAG TPA: PDZ domain-containing protein, partial [Terriglobales bacterium]|nr:PDZ domain-containing protein [Terriglobales bacterium]
FVMGTRELADKRFPTAQLEVASAALGVSVDGVIGTDILLASPFQINYSKQELMFGPLSSFNKPGKEIKLIRSEDDFFVPLQIHSVPINLLLDSGSNSTNLSWGTWQKLLQVWQPNSVVDGVMRAGFSAPPAFFVCLPNLSVGGNMLMDQVVRVQRQVSDGAFADANFGGILGSEFLRQFVVTFDLANNRIFLKKDPLFKRDLYRFTAVGFQFARQTDNTYAVMGIWKNSPAQEAGIKVGDRILSVNGVPTQSLSSDQLSGQLHGAEGTTVRLLMKRNSVVSAVTLHTRQMLCSPHNVPDQLRASQK